MSITVNSAEDRLLAARLAAESEARATNLKSGTARNVLFGSAAVIGALGLAMALILLAVNYKASEKDMALSLAEALAKVPLKVELAKDAAVAIKDGETVALDPAIVTLDPKATIAVEAQPAMPDVASQPVKTDEGEAIKREVTVFSTVAFDGGDVVTGWQYANGAAKVPTGQYCYFNRMKPDGRGERVDLAINRIAEPRSNKLLPNADEARAKCQWFGGAA